MSYDGLLNVIRREAAIAVASREFRGTLVVTAFNPQTYAVKGVILPHEVESGWIQITGDHIGNGFGHLAGPKVGSADKLDGDQFAIEFDRGDPNTLIATHRIFSDQDKPPQVQSGEMLSMHQKGHKLFFAQDGSVTIYHAAKGGVMQFDASGDITHDAKGANITVQSQGGKIAINGTVDING